MRFSRMVNVVKCHVGGEVNNVVTGGIGDVPGATVFEKMKYFRDHDDELRQLLLHEPRGAVTHCVNYIVPGTDPEAQLGYVIAESTEYPAMSGSNTMCVATALLETGMVRMTEPVGPKNLRMHYSLISRSALQHAAAAGCSRGKRSPWRNSFWRYVPGA